MFSNRITIIGTVLPLLILLVLYLLTVCPTIYSGDAAELATAGATFGIPHPPGYPLYTLLANLWSRLIPFGEVAWRINLLSVLSAAAAALLLMLSLRRLQADLTSMVFAALTLGVGVTYWSQAIISEVYAFDIMLATLALYAAVRAREQKTPRSAMLALVCLSLWLGHRNVNLIYSPALLALAWPALRPGLGSARGALALGAALVLPLCILLYLPIASSFDPMLDTGDPQTLSRWLAVITSRVYSQYMQGGFNAGNLAHVLQGLPRELGIALILAPLGLLICYRRQRTAVLALGYMTLANLLFAAWYAVPDVRVFALPAILGLAALAGLAAARLIKRHPAAWIKALLLVCVVPLGVLSLGPNNIRNQTLALDFAQDALSFPADRGLVLSHVDTVSYSLWYAQYVEQRRPDLLVVSKGRAVDWHQEQARRLRPDLDIPLYSGPAPAIRWPAALLERNSGSVPVYVTANLQGYFGPAEAARLSAAFEESPAGLLTRLAPRKEPPSPAEVIGENQRFWDRCWPHALEARKQRLDTEMSALLLHYATMRVLFARYALWHGSAGPAGDSARAVLDLDPGPVIQRVNRDYQRRGARYHMSNMPELAAMIRDLARALASGQTPLAAVRQKLMPAPSTDPPRVHLLNQQGIRLAQQGRLADALRAFDGVLELMPQHRGALFNRAKVLVGLGQHIAAAAAYEQLLRLSPSSLPALVGLAELKAARDPQAAMRLLERAASSPGPEPLRQLARQRLAELQGRLP